MAGEDTCDRQCDEQLRHFMTSHVRQFTAPKVSAQAAQLSSHVDRRALPGF